MTREDLEKVPSPADDAPATGAEATPPLPVMGPGDAATGEKGEEDGADDESEEDVEARLAYESLMRHRRARRRKKLVAAGVVAGALALAGVAWAVAAGAGAQSEVAPTLQTVPLVRGEFSESVQATGTAQPRSSVVVTPEVDGIVASVDVALDDTVSEGQVLLTIKNDDLDRTVRQQELALRQQRQATSEAQEAYNALWREARATGDWTAANAQLINLESARLELEIAQEAYDDAVRRAASRTVVAPASGSVVAMNAVTGASVGAGGAVSGTGDGGAGSSGPLVQIADLSQMTVKVQVNEVDISRIAVGQQARVTFSALPEALLDAEVTRISTVAASDPYGYGGGVVTYEVELLIPEPVPELKPGMTANVEIMMQYEPDALTVPVSALGTDDGEGFYVYVLTDEATQATERRSVTVGSQSASTAVVEGDVSEGDLVVLDAFSAAMAEAGPDGMGGAGAGAPDDGVGTGDVATGGGAAVI